MPVHVHLVLLPQDHTRISSILSAIKQPVSKQAIAWLKKNNPQFLTQMEDLQPNGNRAYRFWQRGGGYDRNLCGAREIHEKIRYVHENPVRRGLVPRAEDWAWSSALAWQANHDLPLRIDRESVPALTLTDADTQSSLWR